MIGGSLCPIKKNQVLFRSGVVGVVGVVGVGAVLELVWSNGRLESVVVMVLTLSPSKFDESRVRRK